MTAACSLSIARISLIMEERNVQMLNNSGKLRQVLVVCCGQFS